MTPSPHRPGADRAPDRDPSTRPLWAVGIPAAVLALAAFLLWGFGGTGIVIDLIALYCG